MINRRARLECYQSALGTKLDKMPNAESDNNGTLLGFLYPYSLEFS